MRLPTTFFDEKSSRAMRENSAYPSGRSSFGCGVPSADSAAGERRGEGDAELAVTPTSVPTIPVTRQTPNVFSPSCSPRNTDQTPLPKLHLQVSRSRARS